MDTRADVIRLCMGLPDSYEDYPFDDPNWTAIPIFTTLKFLSKILFWGLTFNS